VESTLQKPALVAAKTSAKTGDAVRLELSVELAGLTRRADAVADCTNSSTSAIFESTALSQC
jgi:hypothetical protein